MRIVVWAEHTYQSGKKHKNKALVTKGGWWCISSYPSGVVGGVVSD